MGLVKNKKSLLDEPNMLINQSNILMTSNMDMQKRID